VCWNCGVALFMTLVYVWMTRLTAEQICTKYIEEDESAPIILAVVTTAALFSVVAIVEPLATIKQVAGAERVCTLRTGGPHAGEFVDSGADHVHDALRRLVLQRKGR